MVKEKNAKPKDYSLQNKMFRKFFYENSAPLEDLVTFVEVTNSRLAQKLGLTGKDQIVVVQNTNRYNSLPKEFKLVNLELERSEPCKEVLDSTLQERLGEDFFRELTPAEIVEQIVIGDNTDLNVYQNYCDFMQKCMLP